MRRVEMRRPGRKNTKKGDERFREWMRIEQIRIE
jgi:hypothetical protein